MLLVPEAGASKYHISDPRRVRSIVLRSYKIQRSAVVSDAAYGRRGRVRDVHGNADDQQSSRGRRRGVIESDGLRSVGVECLRLAGGSINDHLSSGIDR